MPRVCSFTGRRTRTGHKLRYRGKAKYLGGVGRKVTSKTKRKFRPNLQLVRAEIDGKPTRVRTSTRAMKSGLVVKPPKRKYVYTRPRNEAAEA